MFTPDRDAERRALAESLLALWAIAGRSTALAGALPHVDKRLVEIARALALAPARAAARRARRRPRRRRHRAARAPARGAGALRHRGDPGRARHEAGHGRVGPCRRARCRREDRRGRAARRSPPIRRCSRPIWAKAPARIARARRRSAGGDESARRARPSSAGYGPVNVLRDVAVAVAQGEMVAVLGPNGAGKSTLMRALSGLGRPVGGEIRFSARRSSGAARTRIAARGLVLVPEGRQVFPRAERHRQSPARRLRAAGRRRRAARRAAARALPAAAGAAQSARRACFPAASSRCSRSRAA